MCAANQADKTAPKLRLEAFDEMPREAEALRIKVFMDEQGFKNEFDETDKTAKHMVLFAGDVPVGVCRVFAAGEPGTFIIGRVAVEKDMRRRGFGSAMLALTEEYIKSIGGRRTELHSQCRRKDFYARAGYTETGGIEDDEGCPHIMMFKEL